VLLGNGGFITGYGRIPTTIKPSLLRLLETRYYQGLPVASAHDYRADSGRNLTGQNLQPERSVALDQLSLLENKLDRLSRGDRL